ncbi:hypothetical protein LXL04_022340 [Taraxacum kok-saghyz]
MSGNEDADDYQSNGHPFQGVKQRLKDRSRKVAQTKEKTKEILSKQAVKIAQRVEEHESFITKDSITAQVLAAKRATGFNYSTIQLQQYSITAEFNYIP